MAEDPAVTPDASEESTDTAVATEEKPAQQVTVEDAGPARKKLTIEIPQERIEEKIESLYGRIRNDAQIPGFRRGRAPQRLIEKRFGDDIKNDAKGQLLSEGYSQAIEEHDLDVLGEPDVKDVDEIELPESGPLKFEVEVEVSPDFELPDLSEIKVEKPSTEVSDDDVTAEIERFRERMGKMSPVEDESAEIAEGDYEAANRLFAAAAAEVAEEGAMVWVQDYHLHLVPRMLRERRPDLKIGFFLHIPFPGRGLFAQLPWRTQLIQGTLGADVVGFQSIYAARNFVDLATRYGDAEALPPNEKGEANRVKFDGREVTVDAYPISIETKKYDAIARSENVRGRAEEYRRRLPGRKIMLGIDRMDYTKGIDTRLRAFQDLLRSGRVHADEVVMIQSAVPTREGVDEYAELRSDVEELVGQINGEFGEVGRVAVQYLRQNLDIEDLVALYAAADVMLVTPLRDGMNLVAKEYVASHPDERGVLILSEFTGASNELTDALIVNPHDLDGLVNAMERAIRMEPEEVKRRQRALRRVVFEHDVHAWAASFMERLSA